MTRVCAKPVWIDLGASLAPSWELPGDPACTGAGEGQVEQRAGPAKLSPAGSAAGPAGRWWWRRQEVAGARAALCRRGGWSGPCLSRKLLQRTLSAFM